MTEFHWLLTTLIAGFCGMAAVFKHYYMPLEASEKEEPIQTPIPETKALPEPPQEPTAPIELSFDTPKQAWHSVRVLCDEMNLSFSQKNELCACVFQESRFKNKGVVHDNGKTKDYGICQYNDGKSPKTGKAYWIGEGALFSSPQDVFDNPERAVRTMITLFKAGQADLWASYSSGAYKEWLPTTSPMWDLAKA